MKSKGFTFFIEVMIVVAIIGILIAIFLGPRVDPKQRRAPTPAQTSQSATTVTFQCVGGYQVFVFGETVTQARDSLGNYATCVE